LDASPSSSFPVVMGSDAALEGLYRLLNNKRVRWSDLLGGHLEGTVERCTAEETIVVSHDTTEFHFRGEDDARKGLGYLANSHRGFEGHFALALGVGEQRRVLGVLGLIPVVTEKRTQKVSASHASRRSTLTPQEKKKSARWATSVEEVEARLSTPGKAVHVMDREADAFVFWSEWMRKGIRFVVRGRTDRFLEENGGERMSDVLAQGPIVLEREVPLSPRRAKRRKATKAKPNRKTPARTGRVAKLQVRAAPMQVRRPVHSQTEISKSDINVVHVFEPNPPEGEDPVSWMLLTSEPIDTAEDVAKVVDFYRSRWVIEELFKAIKTGCAYERRQLMSLRALLNALALLIPIAWRMLALRAQARHAPTSPAAKLFTADELDLLRKISVRVKLSVEPSAEEVLLAIAGLGGHLKNNGPPGWQTIGGGFERFLNSYAGWCAARSDQS
jgi:IS4 transposase